jgi:hypothetical protein
VDASTVTLMAAAVGAGAGAFSSLVTTTVTAMMEGERRKHERVRLLREERKAVYLGFVECARAALIRADQVTIEDADPRTGAIRAPEFAALRHSLDRVAVLAPAAVARAAQQMFGAVLPGPVDIDVYRNAADDFLRAVRADLDSPGDVSDSVVDAL